MVKPTPGSKTEELIKKADLFSDFISKYSKMNIKHVLIEEPLLRSNNVRGLILKNDMLKDSMVVDCLIRNKESIRRRF